ncbi:bifunctional DNA-formamidopyrimidine glycosylase/DNA-(apurinic or apyrimidinic site) lyase [Candidatus Saccharibacteria bacterium]|nr:bifunctional DNA-formamidopyrimidine glycosylase/DNA-(apurinic or apyrimidinic site) lyase [Candidatus Saccharibacteria bacterium]
MPELPEVEIVRRGLDKYLKNQKIVRCEILTPKSFKGDVAIIAGARIQQFDRKGKLLILGLNNHYSLLIHLRMTGQLIIVGKDQQWGAGHPNDSFIGKMPDRTTRVVIQFKDYALYFNDQRKFGYIELWPTNQLIQHPFISRLALDILDMSREQFQTNISKRPKSSIKSALLDQAMVAGMGNIYVDEALNVAGIRPDRLTSSLSPEETIKVYQASIAVINQGINAGGSTSKNYVNVDGGRGKYLDFARVYGRAGQKCNNCQAIIIKQKHASRGTHFCPNCQS